MQPLQICIGPIIRIGRESWCLPYAGFFQSFYPKLDFFYTNIVGTVVRFYISAFDNLVQTINS